MPQAGGPVASMGDRASDLLLESAPAGFAVPTRRAAKPIALAPAAGRLGWLSGLGVTESCRLPTALRPWRCGMFGASASEYVDEMVVQVRDELLMSPGPQRFARLAQPKRRHTPASASGGVYAAVQELDGPLRRIEADASQGLIGGDDDPLHPFTWRSQGLRAAGEDVVGDRRVRPVPSSVAVRTRRVRSSWSWACASPRCARASSSSAKSLPGPSER